MFIQIALKKLKPIHSTLRFKKTNLNINWISMFMSNFVTEIFSYTKIIILSLASIIHKNNHVVIMFIK